MRIGNLADALHRPASDFDDWPAELVEQLMTVSETVAAFYRDEAEREARKRT